MSRVIATEPVRAISRTPKRCKSATSFSIFSSLPVTSRVTVSCARSTMCAPKWWPVSMISARVSALALTLTRASSRATACSDDKLTTCRTSTILRSCSINCSTPTSESLTWMVMRETFAISLWPMEMVCGWARRRRSTPTIRSTMPGSLFASTSSVCERSVPFGASAWPALSPLEGAALRLSGESFMIALVLTFPAGFLDHGGDGGTRCDHRIDIGLGLDHEIDDDGPLGLHGLAYSFPHIDAPRDLHSGQPVSIGQFDVVGSSDGRFRVVVVVEEVLPLAHHAEVAVIHDGYFDGDALLFKGRQFLNVHLNTAIACHNPHGCIGDAHFDAHRGWQREAHRSQSARRDMAVGARPGIVARRPHLVLAHVGDDDGITARFGANSVQDAHRIGIFLIAFNACRAFAGASFP